MKIDINLAEGMELSENVHQPRGNYVFLMGSGHVLTKNDIQKLKRYGVTEVSIKADDLTATFNDELQERVGRAIIEADFNEIRKLAHIYEGIVESTNIIKNDMSRYVTASPNEVSPLLISILSTNFAVTLTKLYNQTFGKSHKIEIAHIAEAAMLQDIGLTVSNNKLYFESIKMAYQDDYTLLREKYPSLDKRAIEEYNKDFHPLYSYYIVRGNHFDPTVEKSILLHNEVYEKDTTKEINGLLNISLKDEVDQLSANMAMILKAVEIYNRLLFTGKRITMDRPFETIPQYLDAFVANGTLSPAIVNILKEALPLYPVGSQVMLNDGTIATVTGNDPHFMLKPKIADLSGQDLEYDDRLEVLYPLSEEQIRMRIHQ